MDNEVEFVVRGVDKSDAALDSAERKAQGFGGKLGDIFSKMGPLLAVGAAAAGLAAGAALFKGITLGLEKEDLTATLEASLAPEDVAGAGEAAAKAFRAGFASSMAEAADAVGAVKSALGELASGEDLDEATRNALNFAKVFKVDVAESTQLAQNLIKNGLAMDAADAFDLMTRAAQRVPQALRGEIVDAASEYGQFFNQLGFNGPEAFDLLARGAEKGQYGIDKAGDAIKEFTIRIADGNAASKQAFKDIGLDAQKMSEDFLAGGDRAQGAFQKTIDGLLAIKDPVKQAQASLALFGTPLEDLSTAQIPEFLAGMDDLGSGMTDVAGAADQMSEKLDTNASKLTAFKNSAADALADFGGRVIGVFQEAMESPAMQQFVAFIKEEILPVLQRIGDWVREKVIPVLKELQEERLAALKEGFNTVKEAIKENEPQLRQLVEWLKKIADFIVEYVLPAFSDYGSFLIGAFARAISFAIDYISMMVRIFVTVRDTAKSVVSDVRGFFDGFIGFLSGLPGRASGAFSGMFDGVKSAFRSALNWVIQKWNDFSIPGLNTPFGTVGGFNTPNIPMFGAGGISGGGLAIVGDRGRELLRLPSGSQVMSNPDTERYLAGQAGSGTTVVNIYAQGSILSERDLVRIIRDEFNNGGFRGVVKTA